MAGPKVMGCVVDVGGPMAGPKVMGAGDHGWCGLGCGPPNVMLIALGPPTVERTVTLPLGFGIVGG